MFSLDFKTFKFVTWQIMGSPAVKRGEPRFKMIYDGRKIPGKKSRTKNSG